MIRISAFSDEAATSIGDQISALLENNITYTDVRNINGKSVDNFTDAEIAEYKKAFDAAGIRVNCIGSPLGKVALNVDMREYTKVIERICRAAKLFETDKVRIFSFYEHNGDSEKVKERLAYMVDIITKNNLVAYHENEANIYGEMARECLELTEIPGLKTLFDPANYVLAGQDMDKAIEMLVPKTEFFHIKDARKTGEIVPSGFGDGQIKRILASKNDFTLTVEPHLTVFSGFENLTATALKQSGEFVYKSNREAFDSAVNAVKAILSELGYSDIGNSCWDRN